MEFASAQKVLIVSGDGNGAFKTIQQAFNAVPKNNKKPVTIFVRAGIYKEKLVLDSTRHHVMLVGEDKFHTILTYDDHTGKISPRGDTINTYTSASCLIAANDFTASNICFQNDAGFTAGQAVAVQVTGDRARFFDCRFIGNQDVLFPSRQNTRQYFEHCYIEGTTDFIFGPSTAWFEQCHIHSKKNSHVTAASTPKESGFGYVFNDCILTADTGLTKVSLGRPWRPYASVTYIHCWIGSHILPEGWNNWKNPENEKTARFAEYQNYGPGADIQHRFSWTRQFKPGEVKQYKLITVLNGWNPKRNK